MKDKIEVDQAWQEYKKKLFLFIRTKVSTAESAEDILSDVFVKLIKVANEDRFPDNLGAWLYRVTKNLIIDYYRSTENFDQLPDDLAEDHEDFDAIKSISGCVLPMIRALPENYQHPLMLSEIDGKRYKEVASELNLTIPAVKSRILRGRKMLYGSFLACCEINYGHTGNLIDYQEKRGGKCEDCGG